MYTDITILRLQFEAEVQCINEHIESIKQLLALDYSTFENKVINCKLSKFIDHSIIISSDSETACFVLYSQKPYVLTAPDKNNVRGSIYALCYRNIRIEFAVIDSKRFHIASYIESLNNKLILLESELLKYIKQINGLESNFKKIEDFKIVVQEFYKQFTGEMYTIARNQIERGY